MRDWITLALLALNSNAYGQVTLLLCRLSTIFSKVFLPVFLSILLSIFLNIPPSIFLNTIRRGIYYSIRLVYGRREKG